MNKIEVGEYVRIKDCRFGTKIAKITKILEKDPFYKNMQMYQIDSSHKYSYGSYISYKIYKEDILKHSKNIIDLIQVGDIVNRRKVIKVFIDPFIKKRRLEIEGIEVNWQGDMSTMYIENEDIKSIVTKEQFEKMKYIV